MKKTPTEATEARKPKLVYSTKWYDIFKIPHNYHSVVKQSLELKNIKTGIGRDCYTALGHGLDRAKEDVEGYIADHFRPASRPRPFIKTHTVL